ncbi:MAG: type II toxin-antitoxin system HicB family antitoxin [Desulfobacterales bacterium]
MLQSYPVIFIHDENDTIIAEFPDVPEAMTVGSDEKNAIAWAQDALIVALTGYIEERRDIPPPSKAKKGQKSVHLPPQIAMKLAIYQSMRDQKVTQAALGECLGVDGRQVRRILDLDHNTTLSQLNSALRCLGKVLVIDIRDAA